MDEQVWVSAATAMKTQEKLVHQKTLPKMEEPVAAATGESQASGLVSDSSKLPGAGASPQDGSERPSFSSVSLTCYKFQARTQGLEAPEGLNICS